MNAEVYAEWLRRQGYRVVQTESTHWFSEGLGVYQAFPFHLLLSPSSAELREMMLRHHATALRYSASPKDSAGIESYHVVYTRQDYGFEALSPWARKNVRRGLRLSTVTPIPLERYADEGWELRTDTLARQNRHMGETRAEWLRRCKAMFGLDGFEVWAAQVKDQLAATLLVFQMEGWGYMLYQQCHRDYLREHVNNALVFVVTQSLIRRQGIQGVFYGMQSLDAPASVDEFKFRMGYEARPVRQHVVFHPRLAFLANPVTHAVTQRLAAWFPGNRRLSKAEGMLRFYLDASRSDCRGGAGTPHPSVGN